MRIDHVALWSREIDALCEFYESYFGGNAGPKYENRARGFKSRFVTFADGGVLELMSRSDVKESAMPRTHLGLTHLAFDCGSREQMDALTERLRADGYPVLGEPRMTGDGYYESVVGDPDGNLVELVYKQKS